MRMPPVRSHSVMAVQRLHAGCPECDVPFGAEPDRKRSLPRPREPARVVQREARTTGTGRHPLTRAVWLFLPNPPGRPGTECALQPKSVPHPIGLNPKVRDCRNRSSRAAGNPANRWRRKTPSHRDDCSCLPRTRAPSPPTNPAFGMRGVTCHRRPDLSREISAIPVGCAAAWVDLRNPVDPLQPVNAAL